MTKMRENLMVSFQSAGKMGVRMRQQVCAERFSIEKCGSVTALVDTTLSSDLLAGSFLRHLLSCTCFDLASFA